MTLFSGLSDVIGDTPLVRLGHLSDELEVEILGKLESQNPGGSVKDRIARSMVDDAERNGTLKPGATIIEPTSGNTGIALAMIAAARGYRCILTMPEGMSPERVSLLKAYGAEVILTPGTLMQSAVEQAEALGRSTPSAVLLRQFDNPANPRAHELTTAEELYTDTEGDLDAFVAGIGTGGTITGVARVLKPRIKGLKIVGVEPAGAAILNGQAPTGHNIQGLGAGFVPKVLDRSLIDHVFAVTEEEALSAARRLTRTEGILCGPSSGAALHVAMEIAKNPEMKGKRIAVVLCDTGERYVSTSLFETLSA